MSVEASALALAWVAILLLSLAVAGLVRQIRVLSSARYQLGHMGPVRGAIAPGLRDYLAEHTGVKLLLFVDSTCSSCRIALDEASRLASLTTQPTVMAVFEGASDGYDPDNVIVISEAQNAFAEYNVQVRPFAVLVDGVGRIAAARPVGSRQALREFVDEARGRELALRRTQ